MSEYGHRNYRFHSVTSTLMAPITMFFVICLTSLLFEAGLSAVATNSEVAEAFMNAAFLPDIVPKPPTKHISVNYSGTSIYLGTRLQPLQTLTQPQVSYEANYAELYTFMCLGPDLPPSTKLTSEPPLTQLIHWGVYNIPGQDISKGVPFATYFPPTPYPDGFPYVFLLFKQNGPLDTSQVPDMSFLLSRPQFSHTEFAKKYDLGDPIAGNFMHVSYLEIPKQVGKRAKVIRVERVNDDSGDSLVVTSTSCSKSQRYEV